MRKALIILFFTGLFAGVSAQYPFHNPGIFYMPAPGPEKYFADKADAENLGDRSWARFQLNTGMMFNSFSGFNSVTSWLSPSVFLPVNSKFAFNISGTFLNNYYPGFEPESGRTTDFIMSFSGIYSLNEKTILYGEYSKSLLNNNIMGGNNFESMTIGMEFKPASGFSIGASFTTVRGINPYSYYSPFNRAYPAAVYY